MSNGDGGILVVEAGHKSARCEERHVVDFDIASQHPKRFLSDSFPLLVFLGDDLLIPVQLTQQWRSDCQYSVFLPRTARWTRSGSELPVNRCKHPLPTCTISSSRT